MVGNLKTQIYNDALMRETKDINILLKNYPASLLEALEISSYCAI
jgi:hypothetical protein